MALSDSAASIPTYEAFTIARPPVLAAPLIVASPHSGRVYSAEFLADVRLDAKAIRRSEDCFVDLLLDAAPSFGVPLLSANFPRVWCDPNREAWELDPAMFSDKLPDWVNTTSARVAAGLGAIPRVAGNGDVIYRRKLRFAEAEQRIETCWRPYHEAIVGLISESRKRFGASLLIDYHSMPGNGRDQPDFVLGDAHGASCAPAVIRHVEQFLLASGYRVRRNNPFAGGYITRHYGRPREGRHALQIEIARRLYMNEQLLEPSSGFPAMRAAMGRLVASLAGNVEAILKEQA